MARFLEAALSEVRENSASGYKFETTTKYRPSVYAAECVTRVKDRNRGKSSAKHWQLRIVTRLNAQFCRCLLILWHKFVNNKVDTRQVATIQDNVTMRK